ncbi:MAG TPA: TfoX/Sxy family protein [Alphaproteobacteria bacterium]|nr:TfoX/Sxy family protein [Alphaproteobacteria bacterium]
MASPNPPLVARILKLLTPLGPVEARRLFGGHGLYLDGTIFALIFDRTLFLKADEKTKGAFERRGCGPITYEGHRGQEVALPYWETPKELLKDGKVLCRWARKAYETGLRTNAKKAQKREATQARKPSRESAPAAKSRRRPRYEPDF